MKPPSPAALRVIPAGAAVPRTLPLGARAVEEGAADALVVVAPGDTCLAAVPRAEERPTGSVVLLAEPVRSGVLGALLGAEPARTRAERCTALLRRGYVRLGAVREARFDVVWGFVP